MLFQHITLIGDDYKKYVEPGRHIQSLCVNGFYCPSATEMLPCGEGNWCSEATVEPRKCDPLSICSSEIGYFQITFINIIIAGILTIIIGTLSYVFITNQRIRNKITRSGRTVKYVPVAAVEPVRSTESLESSNTKSSGVEILLLDAKFSYSSSKPIFYAISNISAHILPGSVTAILG